jgi:hypothetical protein
MVSAIGEYEVEITDGVISFPHSPSYPTIIATANNTALTDASVAEFNLAHEGNGGIKTTLGGIAEIIGLAYYTDEGLVRPLGPHGKIQAKPVLSPEMNMYVLQHITNFAKLIDNDGTLDCAPAWRDPRDAVMAKLVGRASCMRCPMLTSLQNELMFRTGLYVAQQYDDDYLSPLLDEGVTTNNTAVGRLVSPVEVFHADMTFFAAAAGVQLLAIFAILVTFYGWWDIGRSATMSPLEIAKVSAAHRAGTAIRAANNIT